MAVFKTSGSAGDGRRCSKEKTVAGNREQTAETPALLYLSTQLGLSKQPRIKADDNSTCSLGQESAEDDQMLGKARRESERSRRKSPR